MELYGGMMKINRNQEHDTHQRKPYSSPKLTAYGDIYQKTHNTFSFAFEEFFFFDQKTG